MLPMILSHVERHQHSIGRVSPNSSSGLAAQHCAYHSPQLVPLLLAVAIRLAVRVSIGMAVRVSIRMAIRVAIRMAVSVTIGMAVG